MDIKPIETQYKGYRFRSRLEARWAVFFDAIGLRWEYEPEGFDLGEHGWYLPDFYLPDRNLWVEVKRYDIDWDKKVYRFSYPNGFENDIANRVILVSGSPDHYRTYDFADMGVADEGLFTACPVCGKPDFCYGGWGGYVNCSCIPVDGTKAYKVYPNQISKVNNAIIAAMSARFEHGEKPISRAI